MTIRARVVASILVVVGVVNGLAAAEDWLSWSARRAETIGRAIYVSGRVGGVFDTRLLKTERAHNYKLAATWMTPDVIRASARLLQLSGRLSDQEALALVSEAESVEGTVILVEIDPREGSGIIPNDWTAFLQPVSAQGSGRSVRGVNTPRLREVPALAGVLRRNYDYDRFWVVFPLKHQDGTPVFASGRPTLNLSSGLRT